MRRCLGAVIAVEALLQDGWAAGDEQGRTGEARTGETRTGDHDPSP
jgi:hypothetical protein